MPNFQPYANPQYFGWLLLALLPLMVALYCGKRLVRYEILVNLGFILVMFAGPKGHEGLALIGYLLWQVLLIKGYATYRKGHNRTGTFVLAVILALLPLVVVKLTPAIVGRPSLIGFLGISYLTFKAVQLVMALRDGAVTAVALLPLLRFMLFFPTLSSGPIDRYQRFVKDANGVPDRATYLQMVQKAVDYLFLGALYKFVLGHVLGSVLLPHFARMALGHRTAMLGLSWSLVKYMYTYSLYLFFDFAGYSLFAVAISYLMGIASPMNFNQPFRAVNIKDFWNRWHMSLSFWFRDFVFMRTTFYVMKHKLLTNRIRISQVAYLVNFLLMGFWHGLTWYYVAYGLFHWLAITVNDAWLRFKKHHRLPSNRWTQALAVVITFNVVCFSFLIFSGFLDQLWFHPPIHK